MPRKSITLDEAAALYGVSRRSLRRYIAAGLISGYRIGPKLIRLDPDELEQKLFEPVTTT